MLKEDFIISARATLVTLVLTGLLYPLATTGIALIVFPQQARGSLAADGQGKDVGSQLIGQSFSAPVYLQPRPSAAGEKGYDAAGSSGSNLGPTSKALRKRASDDLDRLLHDNPDAIGPVPAELVAASASGLDPHLSPGAALWQVPRIARARGLSQGRVRSVIESHLEGRDLMLLGEPRVNVLLVNLALDRQFGRPASMARK
jgi:K+-transporting ATPase ATPase C chain